MHTHDPSPTARPHGYPVADDTGEQDTHASAELTDEEQAALAVHRRHISETSYLPAQTDYLHVR